jgi:hypothetical protein
VHNAPPQCVKQATHRIAFEATGRRRDRDGLLATSGQDRGYVAACEVADVAAKLARLPHPQLSEHPSLLIAMVSDGLGRSMTE